ncbi:MAG: peptide deformylase [Acidobacteriia bacterium]|nr:peptide deformylase [Terriglobia bacterium]
MRVTNPVSIIDQQKQVFRILKYGAEVLQRKAAPVTKFDAELRKLFDRMIATMYAEHGVGLAAPQVGVSQQVAVIDISGGEDRSKIIRICNPEIVESHGKQSIEEGCLSFPEIRAVISRPKHVLVKGQDMDGNPIELEGDELLARAFCHEIDHLNGVLIIDHVSALKRDLIKRRIKRKIKNGEWG